jgi:TetR/AcrR family transcriptional repressor of nem operon
MSAPRPKLTAKGQATRDRIVKAAAGLVFEHGVAGTGIEDVRKAAGVSGSQMTHYFRDKRSLVRAVVAWRADQVVQQYQRLDSFDALYRWAELTIERQTQLGCRHGCDFGSLAGELAESDADTRHDLAAGFERWAAVFRHGLRAMCERGDLRPETDTDELALGLLAALQGGLLLTQTSRDVRPLEAALNTVLAHIRSFATAESVRAGRRRTSKSHR